MSASSGKRNVNGYEVEIWTRRTLADGSNMYNDCIKPICDAIEDAGSGISGLREAIDAEVVRATNAESALNTAITDETTRATNAEGVLDQKIDTEIQDRITAINAETTARENADIQLHNAITAETQRAENVEGSLKNQIDALEAATDVIAVFGSYSAYIDERGSLSATDKDIVKVLIDEDHSNKQTYYQYDTETSAWTTDPIASLEPYYSVNDINTFSANISATISGTYLSATAIKEGNNIIVTKTDGKPEITISTSADVVFDKITADTAIFTSGKITTGNILTAYGSSAKFDNISASGISSNSAIINTISGHSAHFDEIDISAIDLENIIAKNISATSSLSGKDLTISNSAKIVGISSTNVSSTNISALNLTANTASGQSANFDDISGKNISANIISGTNVTGDKLTVNTSAKIVGISATNVSSTNITANSLIANTATGNSAKFTDISATNITGINLSSTNISAKNISGLDNITAKNISATNNISANSATIVNVSADVLSASYIHSNISSFFKDVSVKNLTADFGRIPSFSTDEITANSSISSKNITADYIEGTNAYITNITADSGYFTDLRGETLQGESSSIDVDELISAVSSMSGESNLYVRKDELECKIGTDNSATIRSFAQGKSNRANENSFVQGNLNSANDDSVAQGYYNSADKKSFAQGDSNTAYFDSLAQGEVNRVSNYSIGQGQANSATNYSIAQGYHNDASNTAQAFGSNLVIESAMAIGKFNKTSSDAVFVIGNGTADDARNDLMVVDNAANITLKREEANDIYSVIINPNILSGSYSSNRGGIISTGNYQSDWISICRNASGDYVPKTANQCSIGEANNTALGNYVLVQGELNFANTYSFAQGTDNTAKYNSIAQGSANSATNNAQAFGEQAYASAGVAINPHLWGSTTPTMAINNSFAMGKECVATADSLSFGQNNTATVWSMAFGQNNTASNFSIAFGLGISSNDNQYIYGAYPSIGRNTVFAIGNGTSDNDRSNYVSINKYGTLNLKNVVNNANKSVIINGHEGYIRSEEKHRNIPFLLTSAYALSDTIGDAPLLETPKIVSESLLLYGQDSWYLSLWIPTGTSSNSFRLIKAQSYDAGTYIMTVGVQSGYSIIFKNFESGSSGISARQIKENVETKTSWPVGQAGTEIDRTLNSIYYPATNKNTCFLFKQIPSNDTIDVIVDSFSKQFIMIKNHAST